MSSLLTRLKPWASAIDRFNTGVGHAMAWAVVLMTAIVVYDVSMRFLFQMGSVMLQELEWHLFGMIFLLGAAYTYREGGHVRVEIIYQRLSKNQQAKINLFGNLFILIPVCLLVMWTSIPFVDNSFAYAETSPDPGGLPYRWLIKSAIPAGFFLLLLQGLADSVRQLLIISGEDTDSN
jgi:TRAP-type mannitol/chloroaromatic compound transport system permease small subunit